jgi:hypothetical protein
VPRLGGALIAVSPNALADPGAGRHRVLGLGDAGDGVAQKAKHRKAYRLQIKSPLCPWEAPDLCRLQLGGDQSQSRL